MHADRGTDWEAKGCMHSGSAFMTLTLTVGRWVMSPESLGVLILSTETMVWEHVGGLVG